MRWKLTIGLYWVRPYRYLYLDSCSRRYMSNPENISANIVADVSSFKTVPSAEKYLELRDKCSEVLSSGKYAYKSFPELSYNAQIALKGEKQQEKESKPGKSNAAFLRWFRPVIQALRDLGGSAIPSDTRNKIIENENQVLNEQGYKNIAAEEFDNTAELCAAILSHGISTQIKRGLDKQYIPQTEALSSLRGKIDISESLKTQTFFRKQMICSYEEFSVNSYVNRIIKSTVALLLRSDVSKRRKKELKKLLPYFSEVEPIDLYWINWNIQYNRNNQTYRMLISICYLVVKGLLQTQSDGTTKLMDFLDEQRMHRLYEKFILEYYRHEFPQITTNAAKIPWKLDDGGVDTMLPEMRSDIMLEYREKFLIIDAKYYSHTTQIQYDKRTLHSNNLYQIFSYVKNKEAELENEVHEVSGMILYAQTDEAIQPNSTYRMSGNKISIQTLDLSLQFSEIARQLNDIAQEHFGIIV